MEERERERWIGRETERGGEGGGGARCVIDVWSVRGTARDKAICDGSQACAIFAYNVAVI